MRSCAESMAHQELQVHGIQQQYGLRIFTTIGRHCCLWCHIKQQDLKLAPTTPHEGRSLATLTRAHSDFVSKGKSDHSKVKEYFNVLAPPILVIPLDQVIKQDVAITFKFLNLYRSASQGSISAWGFFTGCSTSLRKQ